MLYPAVLFAGEGGGVKTLTGILVLTEHRQLHERAAQQYRGVYQPKADGLARAGADKVWNGASPPGLGYVGSLSWMLMGFR